MTYWSIYQLSMSIACSCIHVLKSKVGSATYLRLLLHECFLNSCYASSCSVNAIDGNWTLHCVFWQLVCSFKPENVDCILQQFDLLHSAPPARFWNHVALPYDIKSLVWKQHCKPCSCLHSQEVFTVHFICLDDAQISWRYRKHVVSV